jgi:fumarate reductase subunit C
MATRRPYVRPMDGWWRRNPFFRVYMAREVTAFFVALYALVLLAGLVSLAGGPAAYAAYLDMLRSRWGIALHVVLLLVFGYHTWSWFEIMPKTMPPVVVGGRRLAPSTVTSLGIAAAAGASLLVLVIAWSLAR